MPTFENFGDDTLDCDDVDEYEYPGAPEKCDGQRNNCIDSSAVDMTEVDTDNDGYVVCDFDGDGIGDGYTGAVPWAGSTTVNVGEDCDPYDPNTYPFASEVCDGIYNNCNSRKAVQSWRQTMNSTTTKMGTSNVTTARPVGQGLNNPSLDKTVMTPMRWYIRGRQSIATVFSMITMRCFTTDHEAPDPELDSDEDGYVSCASELEYAGDYAYDASIWVGSTITGDGDCDALDSTVYPNAPEVCDGQFNDCTDEDEPGCARR